MEKPIVKWTVEGKCGSAGKAANGCKSFGRARGNFPYRKFPLPPELARTVSKLN